MGKNYKFRLASALRAGLTAVAATGAKKSRNRSRSRKARLPMAQAGQQGGWQSERAEHKESLCLPNPQLQAADSLAKLKARQPASHSHHPSTFLPTFPSLSVAVLPSQPLSSQGLAPSLSMASGNLLLLQVRL